MKTNSPHVKSPAEWLNQPKSHLGHLLSKLAWHQTIENALLAILPARLSKDIQVANIQQGIVTLFVTQQGAVTELHYEAGNLLNKLKHNPAFYAIKQLKFKPWPGFQRDKNSSSIKEPKNQPVTKLSQETSDLIKLMAESLSDENLKQSMKRIAMHTDKQTR